MVETKNAEEQTTPNRYAPILRRFILLHLIISVRNAEGSVEKANAGQTRRKVLRAFDYLDLTDH